MLRRLPFFPRVPLAILSDQEGSEGAQGAGESRWLGATDRVLVLEPRRLAARAAAARMAESLGEAVGQTVSRGAGGGPSPRRAFAVGCSKPSSLSGPVPPTPLCAGRFTALGCDQVGYRVRLDSKVSRATLVECVTEGVLLRRLQVDPLLEVPSLRR